MVAESQSFAALQGPVPYIKHLVSPPRIPFTAAYFGSLGLTLYFAVGVSDPIQALLMTSYNLRYSHSCLQ